MKQMGNRLLLWFVLFLTFMTGMGVLAAPSDAKQESSYAAGLIWDSPEVIEANLREAPPLESALPPSVNLKEVFPDPGDQGRQESCVPWAVAYALRSHQEEVRQNWGLYMDEHLFSPSYIYNQINRGVDGGTSISTAMDILVNQGGSTLASFPYNESDYLTQPASEQKREAANFRVKNWYTIKGIDSIKRRLAEGDGVVVGIEIFSDFDNINLSNPIFDVVSDTSRGSHALCLIGYDDDLNAFRFINSWGTGWGLDGYGWISYDLMNDTRVSHHGAAVGYVMDPRDNTSIIYEEPFDYTVSDNKTTIIRYFDFDYGGNVAIPGTLGGYPVTAIDKRAFQNSNSITGVIIPDSVTSIGGSAFEGCTSLIGVAIPDSVTYIGSDAFTGCTALIGISVGADNPNYSSEDGVLFDKNKTTLIRYATEKLDAAYDIPGSVTKICSNAFNCRSLTAITVTKSVKSIESGAFTGLSDDANIYVPDPPVKKLVVRSGFPADRIIAEIEEEADTCGDSLRWELDRESGTLTISGTGDMWDYVFSDAPWYSLREDIIKVVIGDGVTSIGDCAFERCNVLTDVVIPNGVTTIGSWVFMECTLLTDVAIPDSVDSIGNMAFNFCRSLTRVVIGNGVTSIGHNAFSELPNTSKIYVSDPTIKMLVENSGFSKERIIILVDSGKCGDDVIWELDMEGTLTVLGMGDIWDYTSSDAPWYSHRGGIKKVIIKSGVTAIGTGAFNDCRIESLMIAVSAIGSTFADMETLEDVTIGDNVTSIDAGAFSGLSNTAIIYVPNQTIKSLVVDSGFPVDRIREIIARGTGEDDLMWILDSEGKLTISGMGDMRDFDPPWFSYRNIVTEVLVENGVTSIGAHAFSYGNSLTSVTISDSVTSIGLAAFMDCTALTSAFIPDSVISIDWGAFHYIDDASNFVPLPNLTIRCYEGSYAHDYAIENGVPFLIIKADTKRIEVSQLPNTGNITVNHITVINTVDGFYNLAVDFEKGGEVFFILGVYEGDLLEKSYIVDGNAEIKGIDESELLKGRIYIWDKNMQPCIEVISELKLSTAEKSLLHT